MLNYGIFPYYWNISKVLTLKINCNPFRSLPLFTNQFIKENKTLWHVVSYVYTRYTNAPNMGLKENLFRIGIFVKDKNKKKYLTIIKEVLVLWNKKKHFPLHYFGRFLYRKDAGHYKDYLDMKEYRSIIYSKKLNEPEYYPILSNKLIFSFFCEKHKLPSPSTLSYNLKGTFFLKGKVYQIKDKKALINFFDNLLDSTGLDRIFIKSLCGYGGKNVHVLTYSSLESHLNEIGHELLENSFIHQEAIHQHEEINKIYSKSINTIRIDTYIDNNGKTHVLGTAMRFGSGGKAVDNISSGGFFVPVNSLNGKLMEKGMQGMIYGGIECYNHPDTGFVFKDFEIPYFKESLELCLKFSKYIPIRLAGWDVAITHEGPVIIEGNHTPYILMEK